MNNNSLDIIEKCYCDSNDGVAVVRNCIITYCNQAMTEIAQRNVQSAHINDIFDQDFINTFVNFSAGKASAAESLELFGRSLDVRSFELDNKVVLLFSRPDNIDALLRKNDESFIALRNAYNRMANALTVLDSSAEFAIKFASAPLPAETRTWLDSISQSIVHLNSAVNDLSEIIEARIKSPLKGCDVYDVAPILHKVSEIMDCNFTIRGIELNVSCSPPRASASLNFRSVVRMLMHMLSHELASPDINPRLKLNAYCTDEAVEFSVSGSGVCEGADHIKFLANPTLESMDKIFARYGTDLYLVRRLASFYDGTIDIKNTDSGRVVTVKLPRFQIQPHVRQCVNTDVNFCSPWSKLLLPHE